MISQHPGGLKLTARAVRKSGVLPPARALDVGCGEGATVAFLCEQGFDASGIDEDAERLPYPDASFDLVTCECVLSLVSDRALALAEMRRVLRRNGVLIVSDVCQRGSTQLADLIRHSGFDVLLEEDHTPALVTYAQENHLQLDDFCDIAQRNPGYTLCVCRAANPLDAWARRRLRTDAARSALDEYARSGLTGVVEYVKNNSRYYRSISLETAGFSALPFTGSADISADPNAFLCVSPRETARCVTVRTSGTTGTSKRLYFSSGDLEKTADYFDYGMRGIARPDGRAMIYFPGAAVGSVGERLSAGLSRFGCDAIVYGVIDDPRTALDALNATQADCVVGVPAQMLALARTGSAPTVRNVLLSGDYVPVSVIRAIENAWNCKVYTHYGMTETGLACAVQCSERVGMHIREPDVYCEIIDVETRQVLPDGQTGELVVTTMAHRAMPLVRYRTGDLTSILPGDCPCGCALRRLGRVLGRVDDPLTPALDEAVYAVETVLAFETELTGSALNITVQLVPGANPATAFDDIVGAAQSVTALPVTVTRGTVVWRNSSVKRRVRNNT